MNTYGLIIRFRTEGANKMGLSNKQTKHIKNEYPGKSVEQLSKELNIKSSQIYKTLGLHNELWDSRLENLTGCLACILVAASPLVFIKGLSDFADMPQRAFIQAVTFVLLLCFVCRLTLKAELKISMNPIFILAAGFILWISASFFWAYNIYECFFSSVHWAACAIVLCLISMSINKKKWLHLILKSNLIAFTGVVFLGLAQQFFKVKFVPMLIPPSATFANANMASEYVVIALPIVIAVGYLDKNYFIRYFSWLITVPSLVFLYYTQCRGAWAAIACAIVWAGLIYLKKKFGRLISFKTLVFIAAALTVISVAWLMTIKPESMIKKVGGSAVYRLIVWKNSFEMIKDKPLLGFGPGNFRLFYPQYTYKAARDRFFDKKKQIRRVHNDYIQTAVEVGLPGAFLFSALLFYGLSMAWRLINSGKDFKFNLVILGISSGIVTFMITAIFSFPFQRSIPPLIVFVYLGVLTFIYNNSFLSQKTFLLKIPKALGIIAFSALLISGYILMLYNWNDINCDRFYRNAMAMEKKGDNKSALNASIIANRYNPDRTDVMATMGRAYVTTGQPEKAIEVLEKVTQMNPNNLNALFILAVAYSNSGDKEKALDTLRRVLTIQPEFKDAKRLIAMLKSRDKPFQVNLSL
jgi:O-antigen ligase